MNNEINIHCGGYIVHTCIYCTTKKSMNYDLCTVLCVNSLIVVLIFFAIVYNVLSMHLRKKIP